MKREGEKEREKGKEGEKRGRGWMEGERKDILAVISGGKEKSSRLPGIRIRR